MRAEPACNPQHLRLKRNSVTSVGIFFLTKDGAIKAMKVSGCLKHTELLYRLYDTLQTSLKPNQDADCNLAGPLCGPVLLSRPQAGRVLEPADPSTYDQRHDGDRRTHPEISTCKYPNSHMDFNYNMYIAICIFDKVTCITNVLLLLQRDNAPFHRILGKLAQKRCSRVR